jgi:alginate O-acetyltransferase complex protein AlgJ
MIRPAEIVFLILIGATLVLPVPLTIWVNCTNPSTRFDWVANRTLAGVTVKKDLPSIALRGWLKGDVQTRLSTLASENFAGRELLIRIYNQILYRVFEKSYMTEEKIIRGKQGNLFSIDYVAQYGQYARLIRSEEAEALVVMMKQLSIRLKELGSCFVFLITPSKATLYPEDIPDRYLTKLTHDGRRPSSYEIILPLLKMYGVPFVDGREITLEHKKSLPVRAFPKTGIHWTLATAFFTAGPLLETIGRESGRAMPQLEELNQSVDHRPDYADDDLFRLLNLIQSPRERYFHCKFQAAESSPRNNGVLTCVGGSFASAILQDFSQAQVFQLINNYSYFKISKLQLPGNLLSSVDENAIPWEEDFWRTTAIVLEANEEAVTGRHLPAFLMAALAEIQQNFPQELNADLSPQPLSWGFATGENGNALAKKGFSLPDHQLTWISSREAEINLPSPRADQELQLILEARPFLEDGAPKRVVNIAANGIPIGTLELVDRDDQFYSLTIKAAANQSHSLKLHLSFTTAPGTAPDGRQFEIGLARLALVPLRLSVSQTGSEDRAVLLDQR